MGVPVLDMDLGGRVVFRHNNVKHGMWETHDKARSGLASAHAYEIYNNAFWADTDKWKALDNAGNGCGEYFHRAVPNAIGASTTSRSI